MDHEIKAELEALEKCLMERIELMERRLLNEFRKWAISR